MEAPAADLGWKQPSDPFFPALPIVDPERPLADWGAGPSGPHSSGLDPAQEALSALSSAQLGGWLRGARPGPAPRGGVHSQSAAGLPGPGAFSPPRTPPPEPSRPRSMPLLSDPSASGLSVFPGRERGLVFLRNQVCVFAEGSVLGTTRPVRRPRISPGAGERGKWGWEAVRRLQGKEGLSTQILPWKSPLWGLLARSCRKCPWRCTFSNCWRPSTPF